MEIDAALFGAGTAALSAMAGFIKVLWTRSEKCIEEHKSKDARIENMEKIIGACEAEQCPARQRLGPRQDSRRPSSPPATT
jgi:hypothetical protein